MARRVSAEEGGSESVEGMTVVEGGMAARRLRVRDGGKRNWVKTESTQAR